MLGKLLVVAVMMFGFGYALVPMYTRDLRDHRHQQPDVQRMPRRARRRIRRSIRAARLRSSSTPMRAARWRFKPEQRSLDVHPGEMTTGDVRSRQRAGAHAFTRRRFRATRRSRRPTYFKKIECFCFTQQTLDAERDEADAGGVLRRSEAAEGREDDHVVVHVLRMITPAAAKAAARRQRRGAEA